MTVSLLTSRVRCAVAVALCSAFFLGITEAAAAPLRLALIEGLSGPFSNAGQAVLRNLQWAVDRVNAQGGVQIDGQRVPLQLDRYDSKGQSDDALTALRAAIDRGTPIVLQGNSSAVAAALVDAIDKHNDRDPARRVLFLNYSAVDPALTNESCSFWHFRFDAHAEMRMAALMSVLRTDTTLHSVYVIGQDYSFGRAFAREVRAQLAQVRPDVRIVGDELHPIGRIKDFLPYATKILASGAQAVLTGNWGNDLTLLIKAAREVGFAGTFYTFYGNALGVPTAVGEAGVGKVIAVAEWMPNAQAPVTRAGGAPAADTTSSSAAMYRAFRQRFPQPADDYFHLRMQTMVDLLVQAIDQASTSVVEKQEKGKTTKGGDILAWARNLEQVHTKIDGQLAAMRADDHQFQQPLVVGVMDRQGTKGVRYDVEGSGYGFRVLRTLHAAETERPTTCKMRRPHQ
ncbi:branched-chain amino acid ABC transporter substrate-binding protein [Candidatus Symbiobacter mobilis]|uniref:branched-chain amino acid ABC transporter substrate-binding protein n=1 Tax=Candidatus Symbiobacter mobilis TaxID=1436290 RepID=UPI000A67A4ED